MKVTLTKLTAEEAVKVLNDDGGYGQVRTVKQIRSDAREAANGIGTGGKVDLIRYAAWMAWKLGQDQGGGNDFNGIGLDKIFRATGADKGQLTKWAVMGMPRKKIDGAWKYNLKDVFRWRWQYEHDRIKKKNLVGSKEEKQKELLDQQIREKRRQNDIQEGKLINAAEINRQLSAITTTLRDQSQMLFKRYGREFELDYLDMIDRAEKQFEQMMSEPPEQEEIEATPGHIEASEDEIESETDEIEAVKATADSL